MEGTLSPGDPGGPGAPGPVSPADAGRAGGPGLVGEPVEFRPPPRPDRTPLVGRHVVLAPIDPDRDAEPLYAVSHPPGGDPEIWTYLFDGPYDSVEDLRRALVHSAADEDRVFYTVLRGPERDPQGLVSYLRITPEHGVMEIGNIWFGVPLQRTPAATEVIYLLARRAFDELGYRRLEWKCNALNLPSRRAAERFGFVFEGVFAQHMVVKGRNRDTAWFAITDRRWPSVRRGFEAWLAPENFDPDGRQRRRLAECRAGGGDVAPPPPPSPAPPPPKSKK